MDVAPATTGTSGNDTYRADFDMEAAAGAGAHTLGALDAIDGGAGNDTLIITSDNGATAYTMAAATIANVEAITIEGSAAVTADVSGSNVTGLNSLAVTKATSATLTTKNTTDVTVTGVTGVTSVTGAKSVNITQNTNAALNDAVNNGADLASIIVNKAKDVTIVANKSLANLAAGSDDTDVGIVVGTSAANAATGVVNITATGDAADGDDQTLDAITVVGGTTVTVTQVATSDNADALTDANGATHTLGAVTVTAGDATTDVTITQATETSAVNYIAGVTGVKQVKNVTFTAMAANDTVTVDGLTFTAAKALTAAQVAAAFANLSKSETQQDGGITANGIYTGNTSANWTSGAANGATVTFTAVTAATGNTGLATSFTDAGTGTLTAAPAVVQTTAGLTAVTAKTGRLGVDNGAVVIDDNGATASIKNVTIDGYGAGAALGGTNAMDALESLTLKNASGGAVTVATDAVETLTLNVDKVDAGVDLDDSSASITNLTINATGSASSFALTADNLTDLTVNAAAALTLTSGSFAGSFALENVSVTGAAAVNLGNITGNNGLKTFTSTNTAGVTVSIDTDTADVTGGITSYDFGSGADVVTLTDTTVDIAVDLGAGNDKITLATGTTTLAETIDGGEGTDTLVMAAANATTASATTTFETKITGFEKLEVGTVAADGVADVDLANMDDINYVITNGTAAGNGGIRETETVTFSALASGQSIELAGVTVASTGGTILTAANVADAFAQYVNGNTVTVTGATVTGTLANWTMTAHTAGTNAISFQATTVGNKANLSLSETFTDAANPTDPSLAVTAGVNAITEVASVKFGSMVAGDVITVAGLTLTATAITESASITFSALGASEALTIGGMTVTSAAGNATAAEIAETFATGVAADADLTVTGIPGIVGYTNNFVPAATTVVFTSTSAATNVADLVASGTGSASAFINVTQGNNGNLTAAQVAEALDGDDDGHSTAGTNAVAAAVLTNANDGSFTVTTAAVGDTVVFTAAAAGDVSNISVSGNATATNTTDGADATDETVVVTFSAIKAGQSVTVGGVTATAIVDVTAAELAAAFAGINAGGTGTDTVKIDFDTATLVAGFDAASAAVGNTLTFTATTPGLDAVTDLAVSDAVATSATVASSAVVDGTAPTSADGLLTISNMANNGTIELKGANAGRKTTVEMAAASATTLNVMIKDQSGTDLGNLVVDDVETIAITTTDTFTDTTGAENEFGEEIADGSDDAPSSATVQVTGDAVETVTVTGAGDLALTVTAAATLTAVNASTMTGALTYTANVAEMTVTGGSAADNITVAANEVAVNGGDGADTITINAGVDLAVIDGGAGNDTFVIAGAASNKDSYAVFNNVASGDVFDFSGVSDFVAAKVTLATGATESTQAYLNQAITNLAAGEMGWFQYNGNTFVVLDNSGSTTTFQDGTDVVIMIAGLKDLSTGATFNATNDTLEII